MRVSDGFECAAALLPADMRAFIPREQTAEEIRLRAGRAPSLLLPGGERLCAGRAVTPRDLDAVLETATRASAHTALDCVSSGFVTIAGGVRVGLCGEAAVENGRILSIRRLSSVCIRIPHQARGCAREIYSALGSAGMASTLILSPPGAGKTTLLRELVRMLSQDGRRVGLVDERGEVAGVRDGCAAFEIGPCTDVMTGAPKLASAMMLLRAMSPELIAMDEITAPEDVRAIEAAAGCGVGVIATAHAADVSELPSRPLYRGLLELGAFRQAVCIRRMEDKRIYEVKTI